MIRYLDAGWTAEGLGALLAEAALAPSAALRRKGDLARDLGLLGPEVAEDTILQAMMKHPALAERPFVRTPRGTALARPLDRLTELLARAGQRAYADDRKVQVQKAGPDHNRNHGRNQPGR